jgi:hypothetical protein
MSKRTYKVVEVIVRPCENPVFHTLKMGLDASKAFELASILEEKNSRGVFDPNRMLSYLVEPLN